MTPPLSQLEKLARKNERLTLDCNELRTMNRKLMRAGGMGFERSIDELRLVLNESNAKPFQIMPTPAPKHVPLAKAPVSDGHAEIVTAIVSDWHLSEVVSVYDSNGINKYNSVIASNRIYEHAQAIKKIVRLHQAMYKVDKLWLPVLGDMINGTIHEELLLTNDLSDPSATILAARLLTMLVIELKVLGIPIQLDCIVGNHPRMTAKMPTKVQAQTSFDWVIYEVVADQFKNDSQVEVNVHTSQQALVTQYGWRFLIEHGIDVSSGKEEDFEERLRSIFDDPIYREATGLKGTSFDHIIIGNMHKPKMLERTVVNGCMTGQNELGMSWRLAPVRPTQIMFGISKGHTRTWGYPLTFQHVTSDKALNPFSTYTREFMKKYGRTLS